MLHWIVTIMENVESYRSKRVILWALKIDRDGKVFFSSFILSKEI